jgi:RNA polymerase sigma factor (sigma-70 family)
MTSGRSVTEQASGAPERVTTPMRLDADDFAQLYDRHARELVVFFQRRVYDAETAVDLMAETFAAAFRDRRSFRGSDHREAAGWLFGIARHQLASYWRHGAVERRALARLGVQRRQLTDEEIERVEQLAGTAALREEIARALARLGDADRRALELRVVQERPYADVARELAVSEPAARQRVARALRALSGSVDSNDTAVKEL